MKTQISQKTIIDTAFALDAKDFAKFLDTNKISWDIVDSDNMLDYNEGFFNIEVWKGKFMATILFQDGELVTLEKQ